MSELKQFEPNGYNPSTGIYVSREIFTGNWENEVDSLEFTPRTRLIDEDLSIAAFDKEKGLVPNSDFDLGILNPTKNRIQE